MSLQSDESLAGQAIEAGAYEEAVRLLRPLAERNAEYALLALGWIYETGATGGPDPGAARSFYEHAASQGSATAYLYLGWLLWKNGQELEAREAFERGAQLHNEECKSQLVRLLHWLDEKTAGRAMEQQNYKEAVRLLRPLADRNSRWALGFIYETGVTGAPDLKAARSYYERAASCGRPDDYYELGRFLRTVGDDADARAAFQNGAEKGDPPSMSRLGWMMANGRGGPTDVDGGTAWLEKAAANGHIFARIHLLAIDERNGGSIFKKLSIRMKKAALAMRWANEMSKDPRWEGVDPISFLKKSGKSRKRPPG